MAAASKSLQFRPICCLSQPQAGGGAEQAMPPSPLMRCGWDGRQRALSPAQPRWQPTRPSWKSLVEQLGIPSRADRAPSPTPGFGRQVDAIRSRLPSATGQWRGSLELEGMQNGEVLAQAELAWPDSAALALIVSPDDRAAF